MKRDRANTWILRAMPAPEWVVEQWPGRPTIIAVRRHGLRDGPPTDEKGEEGSRWRTGAMALLQHVRGRGSSEHSWYWVRAVMLRVDPCLHREVSGVRILAAMRILAINALHFDGIWLITEGLVPLSGDITE